MINREKIYKVYKDKNYTFDFEIFYKFLIKEKELYFKLFGGFDGNHIVEILEHYNKPVEFKQIYKPLEEFGIKTALEKYNK